MLTRRLAPLDKRSEAYDRRSECQPNFGFVTLARFTLDVARDVANADRLPTWNPGDEFRPAREKHGVK